MHKDLIFVVILATAATAAGCSSFGGGDEPAADTGDGWSFVHKPTIQQGTVLTRDMLDRLTPGMSKEQVRFLLGTPSIVDVFHEDRWDYVYWLKKPGEDPTSQHLILLFDNELLVRIEGRYEPGVEGESETLEDVVVEVPDNAGDTGIVTRTLKAVGVGD